MNDKHSYRTLLIGIGTQCALALTKEGLEAHVAGNNEESMQLATDSFDVLNAVKWLVALPDELCPNVQPSTPTSMTKTMEEDDEPELTRDQREDILKGCSPSVQEQLVEMQRLLDTAKLKHAKAGTSH